MLLVLQVLAVLLISVAFGLALAHALEMPGKRRLNEEVYLAAQTIYYPGFTIGGAAEPLSIIATLVLLLVTPARTLASWLILTALITVSAMQVVFWIVTQPVNRYWLKRQQLKGLGAKFFSLDAQKRQGQTEDEMQDWKAMRDRWEYSHLLRAVFSAIALISLLIAIAS